MPSRAKTKAKWTRSKTLALVALGVAGAMILASVYLFLARLMPAESTAPAALLEPGWQFYARPTSLEPPGTVFRIDNAGRRFEVTEIAPPIITGDEVFGAKREAVRTNAQILARFISGRDEAVAGQHGDRIETLEFEMFDVQKEVTTDMAVMKLLQDFRAHVDYRRENRYYVIRESRSALALRYSLSDALADSLAGKAGLDKMVKGDAGLSYKRDGAYVLDQKLPTRMRVMFLAEEITPSQGISNGKPQFETVPVTEPLVWH